MSEEREEVRRAVEEEVIPLGFRFMPTEKDLLLYYLLRRVSNSWLPSGIVVDFNVYECNPWNLPRDLFRYRREQKEMYFFTRLRRMPPASKPNSIRYARTAGSGVWHGNGQDVVVEDDDGRVVGHSISFTFLVFVNNDDGDDKKKKKKKKQHVKTDWIMHEYRLQSTASSSSDNADLVVCKIYEKNKRKESKSREDAMSSTAISEGEDVTERMQRQQIINRKRFEEEPSNPPTLVPSVDHYHDPQVTGDDFNVGAVAPTMSRGEEIMVQTASMRRTRINEYESDCAFTYTMQGEDVMERMQQRQIINRKRFEGERLYPSTGIPSVDHYHDPQAIDDDFHQGIVAPTISQGEEIMAQMAPTKRRKVDELESNYAFTFTMQSTDHRQHHPNSLDTESVPQDDGMATFVTQISSSFSTFPTPTENQMTVMINNASEHEILNPEPANCQPSSATPHQLMPSSPNEESPKIDVPSPHELNKLISYGPEQGSLPPDHALFGGSDPCEMIADVAMLDSGQYLYSPSDFEYYKLW